MYLRKLPTFLNLLAEIKWQAENPSPEFGILVEFFFVSGWRRLNLSFWFCHCRSPTFLQIWLTRPQWPPRGRSLPQGVLGTPESSEKTSTEAACERCVYWRPQMASGDIWAVYDSLSWFDLLLVHPYLSYPMKWQNGSTHMPNTYKQIEILDTHTNNGIW